MALPISIERLLNDKVVEDVRKDYKASFNLETILPSICAFANDLDNFAGGYILIGIEEKNGTPILPVKGIDKKEVDKIEKQLIEYCKKCIIPNYIPVIEHVVYQKKELIVLWCYAGSDRPYKCLKDVYSKKSNSKHVCYIRKGSTTVAANTSDEKELYSLAVKEPFDDRCNYNCEISDLDKDLVRQFLKESKSSLYKLSSSKSLEELLEDLKVLSGPSENKHPKNIAILMFSNNPEDYIPYSYIELTTIFDPTGNGMIEKVFKGSLFNQFKDAMAYIKNNVIESMTEKIKGEYKALVTYNYPYEAIEEILANAILHKSYQEKEPVSIRIEKDRIEITSIPGFDRTIPEYAIKELIPRSKRYRNRRIAEFLKELGIVEAKNTGYPEIVEKCKANGSPMPIIDMNVERDYVTVIVPIHTKFTNNPEKTLEEKIIAALSIKPMRKTELCKYLGYERIVNSVSNQLSKLEKNKIVKKIDNYYTIL